MVAIILFKQLSLKNFPIPEIFIVIFNLIEIQVNIQFNKLISGRSDECASVSDLKIVIVM